MNLSLEQRVGRVERALVRVRVIVTRLYQTFYAAQIRRGNTYGRMLERTKDQVRAIQKTLPTFTRLGRIARELDRGRMVVTLDGREHQLLHAILRRQKPYKKRG